MQSVAEFPTARGPQLMQTMAKHFGHKIEVEIDEEQALLHFAAADTLIELLPEGLRLSVTAESAEAVTQVCGVVESHLLRFAHREDPQPLNWSAPA